MKAAAEVSACKTVKSRKERAEYVNIPCAFDIETSSTYAGGEKFACMYCWQAVIGSVFVMGRTWQELRRFIEYLCDAAGISLLRRLPVYVHNLSFEFQFMRKHFEWVKIFALKEREPVKALTADGIEFRCSYVLSGYSLAKLGDNLLKYPCRKLVGELDYTAIRSPETPLTLREIAYCRNDVQVVVNYIRERMDEDGNVTKIPLTKTSYVRNDVRSRCLPAKDGKTYCRYRRLMNALTVDLDEYRQLKRAFQGGYTHANASHVGQVCENVRSYDFTSSYPAQMIAGYYPMSKAQRVEIVSREHFRQLLKTYCCMFDVRLTDVAAKTAENYLSGSRCGVTHGIYNNGRIVAADEVRCTMTEIDWELFEHTYVYGSAEISNMRIYRRGTLPKPIVQACCDYYVSKTTLKGVKGKEAEYMKAKGNLNSIYGMMVTDILRDDVLYEDDAWRTDEADAAEKLAAYNRSKKRFLFYPWGVWVTAHARRALWTGIIACGSDYVYSDTDSVKVLHAEKHAAYFDGYNQYITQRLEKVLQYYSIPIDSLCPKNIKGEDCPLGVWDDEGEYARFKTLGAKRYLTEKDGSLQLTVAGLGKRAGAEYLSGCGRDPFDEFDDGWSVPAGHTGKLTHTYIDVPKASVLTDYRGTEAICRELSAVHLEPCEFTLSLAQSFRDYLLGYKEIWRE